MLQVECAVIYNENISILSTLPYNYAIFALIMLILIKTNSCSLQILFSHIIQPYGSLYSTCKLTHLNRNIIWLTVERMLDRINYVIYISAYELAIECE